MKIVVIVAFICSSAVALGGIDDSKKSNKEALAAIQVSLSIAQQAIMASCVKPTEDLMCSSDASMILSAVSGIAGQLTSSLSGSAVSGAAVSAGIGGVSCILIKCDTTESRNTQCDGFIDAQTYCPCDTPGTAVEPNTCRSGATCKGLQSTMNTNLGLKDKALAAQQAACDTSASVYSAVACAAATTAYTTALGVYEASIADCESCIGSCQACSAEDNGITNPNKMCMTGISSSDYNTCILPYKADAQKRQTKCREICGVMVAALAAFNFALTGVNTNLDDLKKQIKSDGGTNSNLSANYNAQTSNNVNSNNTDDNASSTSLSSSLGTLLGAGQGKTAGGLGSSGTSASIQGGGSSSGSGLSATKGAGTTTSSGSGSGSGDAFGGPSSGGGGSSFGGASNDASGSQLRGITNKSINKKELLDKNADLFETVQKIHENIYEKKEVGSISVVKVTDNKNSNNKTSKKKTRR